MPPLPVCSVRNPRTASQPQPSSPRPLPQRSIRRATRTPTLTLSCCRIPSSLAVRSHISPPSCLPTRPRSLPQFASRLALAAIRTSAHVTNHHHPRSCFVRLSCVVFHRYEHRLSLANILLISTFPADLHVGAVDVMFFFRLLPPSAPHLPVDFSVASLTATIQAVYLHRLHHCSLCARARDSLSYSLIRNSSPSVTSCAGCLSMRGGHLLPSLYACRAWRR